MARFPRQRWLPRDVADRKANFPGNRLRARRRDLRDRSLQHQQILKAAWKAKSGAACAACRYASAAAAVVAHPRRQIRDRIENDRASSHRAPNNPHARKAVSASSLNPARAQIKNQIEQSADCPVALARNQEPRPDVQGIEATAFREALSPPQHPDPSLRKIIACRLRAFRFVSVRTQASALT